MKHKLDEATDPNGLEPPAKRIRTEEEASALKQLAEQQEKLSKLEEECERHQMEIQRKFDERKRPHFDERQTIIDKIPNFWGKAIANHPHIATYLIEEDKPILEHVTKVDLEDNIDRFGSYKLTFEFAEAAKEYFEPLVWTKTMKFSEAAEPPTEEGTEIRWKEGKKPQPKPRVDTDDEVDDDEPEESFADWFCKDSSDCVHSELGEIIRRVIFHQPQFHYSDDEEDSDDDEDKSDSDAVEAKE